MPHPLRDDVDKCGGKLNLNGPLLTVPPRLDVGLSPLNTMDVPPTLFQLRLAKRRIRIQAVAHPLLECFVERAFFAQPELTRQDGLG